MATAKKATKTNKTTSTKTTTKKVKLPKVDVTTETTETTDPPLTVEQSAEAMDMDCNKPCSKQCGCDKSHCKVQEKKQENEEPVPDTQPQGTEEVQEKPEEERGHIEVHNYNDEVLAESKYYHRFIEARRCAYYGVKENGFTFSLIKKGKDRVLVTLDKHGEPIFFGDEF